MFPAMKEEKMNQINNWENNQTKQQQKKSFKITSEDLNE